MFGCVGVSGMWELTDYISRSPGQAMHCAAPPLLADIPVIPDLEDVQEEDFVLQVASPPR